MQCTWTYGRTDMHEKFTGKSSFLTACTVDTYLSSKHRLRSTSYCLFCKPSDNPAFLSFSTRHNDEIGEKGVFFYFFSLYPFSSMICLEYDRLEAVMLKTTEDVLASTLQENVGVSKLSAWANASHILQCTSSSFIKKTPWLLYIIHSPIKTKHQSKLAFSLFQLSNILWDTFKARQN